MIVDPNTAEGILFALRMLGAGLMLSFVGLAFWLVWRDLHTIEREVRSRSQARGRLTVLRANSAGVEPGMAYPLLPLTTLGRAPTNSVVISDSFTSGEHAVVTLRGGQWWLEDRNSSNGTKLNGYRLTEPTVLSAGDIIQIGQIELKLELE